MADRKTPQSITGGGGSAGGPPSGNGNNRSGSKASLAVTYPVNTLMELKIAPKGDMIRGLVYCTDEISNSVVIKKSLAHTTLSSEITVVNAASVLEKRAIDVKKKENQGMARELAGVRSLEELRRTPMPHVNKRVLEERERRAIRMMEESFSQVNQRASPEGQKIFDKLLKACNEVVWRGESILVLKEIRVDPPYAANNCLLINAGGGELDEHSLERVKKIVAAASQS